MLLVKLAVGLAVWWVLLKLRLLPTKVMQYWFLFVNVAAIFPLCGLTAIFPPLQKVGVKKYYTERMCIIVATLGFYVVRILNPQIRMYMKFDANENGKPACWDDLPEHGFAVVGNHVSFWDIYAYLIMYPLARMPNMRTLLKSSLLEIPLFGPAMVRIGQFPVYFKSDEDGNFHVDKERQAAVQKEVDRHINEGGNIIFYPEGALNRNPDVLQPFRYGTFNSLVEHRMKAYYLVIVGNEKTWRRGSYLGGKPADICMRLGSFPIDYDTEDAKAVSTRMQVRMQQVYDETAQDLAAVKAGKVPAGYTEV